jgi:hypothetical protein
MSRKKDSLVAGAAGDVEIRSERFLAFVSFLRQAA